MITVFTPTYNRQNELKKLYQSLLKQNFSDFEWLIVDDGSSDNTKDYINKVIIENLIKINYVYKKNGGKQSAYNLGLKKAKGNIFLCIDSDDILAEGALKKISIDFENISDDCAGYAYVQGYISDKKKVIGSKFPNSIKEAYYYDIYGKMKVTGDKLIVLKSTIAKEYPFPMIEGEKFVPEALVFNRIAKKYKLVLSNEIMAYKEYLNDGYSSNYFNLVKRNPNGNALYFKEKYDINPSFYNVYGYILFSIYSNKRFKEIYSGHKAKFKVLLLYFPVKVISKIK